MLLLALIVALFLRLYDLGERPPGLYRDEAFNGLDALKVLGGDHALFFPANNGREPLYIYLSAAVIALFGQTAVSVRLAAALVGSLTTVPVYLLAKSWFGWRVGVIAAWLWAITLWPVHLSRIGLRVILLAPLLAMTFWLGTLAYRRQKKWLWLAAGIVYGLSFYSYLAVRFTPILLILLAGYLLLAGRGSRLWPGAAWFGGGLLVTLLPLLTVFISSPDLVLGRTGQVSIFHPNVNGGDFWGTLLRQIGAATGMFFGQGDNILRHNPAGRSVFDWLMLVPFLIGLVWCLRHWRRPASMTVMLWTAVMLGPTILAEDAPHFLRAAGILPVILFIPALGLERILTWRRLPKPGAVLLVTALILGSLWLTWRDYAHYGRNPDVDQAFEGPAARLAQQVNDEGLQTAVFLDRRLWSDWPSLSFLVEQDEQLYFFSDPDDLPISLPQMTALYAWPYEGLDYIPGRFADSPMVKIESGDVVLEEGDIPPYTLFVRYSSEPVDIKTSPVAIFGDQLTLYRADVVQMADDRLQVVVYWQANKTLEDDLTGFIHVRDQDMLISQVDRPIAQGWWPAGWWQPDQLIQERYVVPLPETYDPERHAILLGLYGTPDGRRLPVQAADGGPPAGTTWEIGKAEER